MLQSYENYRLWHVLKVFLSDLIELTVSESLKILVPNKTSQLGLVTTFISLLFNHNTISSIHYVTMDIFVYS